MTEQKGLNQYSNILPEDKMLLDSGELTLYVDMGAWRPLMPNEKVNPNFIMRDKEGVDRIPARLPAEYVMQRDIENIIM